MRNGKIGCLLWTILVLIIVLWGWKLMDFYVLSPAAIKKGINETVDQVSRINTTAAKQVEFNRRWADWERTCSTVFLSASFVGDSFVVKWDDTLHVPMFPPIAHQFRLSRVVR